MNTISSRILVGLVAGAALFSQSVIAAEVDPAKAETISAGQSRDQVIQSLGQPSSAQKLRAAPGNEVMTYDVAPSSQYPDSKLLIELDSSGKVISSSLVEDGGGNSDTTTSPAQ